MLNICFNFVNNHHYAENFSIINIRYVLISMQYTKTMKIRSSVTLTTEESLSLCFCMCGPIAPPCGSSHLVNPTTLLIAYKHLHQNNNNTLKNHNLNRKKHFNDSVAKVLIWGYMSSSSAEWNTLQPDLLSVNVSFNGLCRHLVVQIL